jgi:hypothetical protein
MQFEIFLVLSSSEFRTRKATGEKAESMTTSISGIAFEKQAGKFASVLAFASGIFKTS